MIKMRESTRQFLERYSDKIEDIKGLLTLGRSMLKEPEYIDLLLTLKSCDIDIDDKDIFDVSYNKYVVTWENNDTLVVSFYRNMYKNNLQIQKSINGLDKLTRGDFIDRFKSYSGQKTHIQLIESSLRAGNYKLTDSVDIFTAINEDNNKLEVHAKLRDNHNNPLILRTTIPIGHYYDHVGYGWNQQRFEAWADYLTRIIQDIIL